MDKKDEVSHAEDVSSHSSDVEVSMLSIAR